MTSSLPPKDKPTLLPCPFCAIILREDGPEWHHEMADCPLSDSVFDDSQVTAWNTRATMTTHNTAQDAGGERNSASNPSVAADITVYCTDCELPEQDCRCETQQSSDMVERVATALARANGSEWNAYGLSRIALEASHHAELVELLEWTSSKARLMAREHLTKYGLGVCDDEISALNDLSRGIDDALDKIAGDT